VYAGADHVLLGVLRGVLGCVHERQRVGALRVVQHGVLQLRAQAAGEHTGPKIERERGR
jgi:hypothetical protein